MSECQAAALEILIMVKSLASFSMWKKAQSFQDIENFTKVSFPLRFGAQWAYSLFLSESLLSYG